MSRLIGSALRRFSIDCRSIDMNRALWITIAGIVVFLLYTCVAPALLSSDDFIFITLGLLVVALPIVAGAMYFTLRKKNVEE